jgi:hypothetical protein
MFRGDAGVVHLDLIIRGLGIHLRHVITRAHQPGDPGIVVAAHPALAVAVKDLLEPGESRERVLALKGKIFQGRGAGRDHILQAEGPRLLRYLP